MWDSLCSARAGKSKYDRLHQGQDCHRSRGDSGLEVQLDVRWSQGVENCPGGSFWVERVRSLSGELKAAVAFRTAEPLSVKLSQMQTRCETSSVLTC